MLSCIIAVLKEKCYLTVFICTYLVVGKSERLLSSHRSLHLVSFNIFVFIFLSVFLLALYFAHTWAYQVAQGQMICLPVQETWI